MKKLYAWQVDPGYQESPLDDISAEYPEIAITGNRRYNSHVPDVLQGEDVLGSIDKVSAIMGESYKRVEIHGCSQSEWQGVYCPESWTREQVHALAAEYFNTGTEWLVAEDTSEDGLTSPDDTDTVSYYDTNNDNDTFRAMLAQEYGLESAQVVLYAFAGYSRKVRYTQA